MDEEFVKELFNYVNECVMYHVENADQMKRFLDFLAHMKTPITVANKVLVFGYDPNATEVRTAEDWKKQGAHVLHPERVLHNMQFQPGSKYSYVDRVMYDVTATDRAPQPFQPYPDAGALAEQLLMYPPCPVVFLEKSKPGKSKAEYVPDKKVIEVTRGFRDETEVCHYLLREFGHFFLKEREELRIRERAEESEDKEVPVNRDEENPIKTYRYDRNIHGLEAQAVAYAVAVRYGIKAPTLENVQTDPKMQPQDVTRVFDRIDFAIGRITRQLEEGPELKKQAKLEAEKQAVEAKQKEREKKEEKPTLREIPHPPNLEGRR